MSETNIFGDDSMVLKTSYSNPRVVAEAYRLTSNTYGDACNDGSELKSFLKQANSQIGELQGNMDNMKASEVSDFRHFDVKTHNNHKVFESYEAEIESDFHLETVVEDIQEQLRENLAEVHLATPSGNAGETEVESDDGSNDEVSDMEAVFDRIASTDGGVSGIGESTVRDLRQWIVANEVSIDHTEIDLEVSVTERYDSLNDVPAETVAELTAEQITELQG